MQIKKIMTAFTGIAMALSMQVPVMAEENEDFDAFLTDEFVEAMESDYLTMHFTIRDYNSLGIEKPEAIIGTVDDDYDQAIEDLQETLDKLESFDYNTLSATQQHDYDALKFHLENMITLNKYPLFDFYFAPGDGIIDALTTNLTEFIFYEKSDFEDYLDIVESVPGYIDEALEMTKKQAAEGYFLNETALDSTLEGIDKFVEKTTDNPLIVIFDENVDAFAGLSDAEKQDYKQRNKDLILNQYIPSYAHAGDVLESLRGSRTYGDAVCDLPDGKEYYAALAKYKSSTDASLEELVQICEDYLDLSIGELYSAYMKYKNVDEEEYMDEMDPEEILAFLQNHLDDYPKGPEVTFKASYLDPSIANDSIVAYYMEPPLDDLKNNVIKINGDNVNDTNEMYTTLAHEGFPGHLYQITWYLNTNPNMVRTQLNMIGYTEGWAMYAEDQTWHLSSLSEGAAEINRIYTNLNYVLDAYADLAVNGLGWSADDLEKKMVELGLNSGLGQTLYEFVTENPGQILPYGVGLAQFMRIRSVAEASLGDRFDVKEFNEVLLTYGDRPFDAVEADVNRWLKGIPEAKDPETVQPEHTTPANNTSSSNKYMYMGIGAGVLCLIVIALLLRSRTGKADRF